MKSTAWLFVCAVGWTALGSWTGVSATESSEATEIRSPPVLEGRYGSFKPLTETKRLPEATFFDESDTPVSLDQFRGKVVLVNFWATWCPPCLKEMPSLDELQAHFAEQAFEVVAICSKCGSIDDIRGFFETRDIRNLRIYTDPELQILPLLGVRGLPTSILLGPEGKELGRLEGDAEWASPEAKQLIEYYLSAVSDG